MTDGLDRRRFVAAVAAALGGCGGVPTGEQTTTLTPPTGSPGTERPAARGGASPTRGGTSPTRGGASPTSGGASPTRGGDLDLREANVVDVAVESTDGGYRFDVTLHHDDDGEDGYANWWQVESLDGEALGRRELLHAHGTREFTRSDTFELPDVDCVVVRGHDQTHGYGGQAMLVTLETGATRAVRQGTEPRSYGDVACP